MLLTIEANETEAITILALKDKIYSQHHILGKGKKPVDKHIWEQMLDENIYESNVVDSIYSALDDGVICDMMLACKNVNDTNKK